MHLFANGMIIFLKNGMALAAFYIGQLNGGIAWNCPVVIVG